MWTIAFTAIKKKPSAAVIVLLVLAILGVVSYFGIQTHLKNVQITQLEDKCETLVEKNTLLGINLGEANLKIEEQNAALEKRKIAADLLQEQLDKIVGENEELEKEIADLMNGNKNAPTDSKEAFVWMQGKALEIKSWLKQH